MLIVLILTLTMLNVFADDRELSSLRLIEPEPSKILFIGDSHTAGIFGKKMDEHLNRVINAEVTTIGSCGSRPAWWETGYPTSCGYFEHRKSSAKKDIIDVTKHKTPVFTNLLDELKPQFVLVALGANLYGFGSGQIEKEVDVMTSEIEKRGLRCLWIGPPTPGTKSGKDLKKVKTQISQFKRIATAHGCEFQDSTEITTYPDHLCPDPMQVHYYGACSQIAVDWAQKTFDFATAKFDFKIRK